MPVEQSHVTVPWTGFPQFAIPDASLDSLVPHHLSSLEYLPEPDPMLPVHVRTAGKTQQSFSNILFLAYPALPVSSHSSSLFFFLSPAHPITWQGYREVPVWADSPSFHWISPSTKTNKTNTATKAKQIKQVIPSTLASQVHPLSLSL